jgi:hypothetical protein
LENLHRLRSGMTLGEVEGLLGGACVRSEKGRFPGDVFRVWQGGDGLEIEILFCSDKVTVVIYHTPDMDDFWPHADIDEDESPFDKLRRWLASL